MYQRLALVAVLSAIGGAVAGEQALNAAFAVLAVVAALCLVYLFWPRGSSIDGGNALRPLLYVVIIAVALFFAHVGTASIDWPWPVLQHDGFTILR